MTDTEREALCARIDELCAEVERLKVANAAFTGRSIRAGDKMACLEAENAKLRVYAAKAWSLFIRHGAVHTCDLSEIDAVRDGLRELGVDE